MTDATAGPMTHAHTMNASARCKSPNGRLGSENRRTSQAESTACVALARNWTGQAVTGTPF